MSDIGAEDDIGAGDDMGAVDDILGSEQGSRYVDRIQSKNSVLTSQTLLDFSHLNDDVRLHLKRVYLLLLLT